MQFTAKTFQGLEDILSGELRQIGAKDIQIIKRAVRFKGDKEVMYKVNYLSRTAIKILWEIDVFYADDYDKLYKNVKKIKWNNFLDTDKTYAIDKTVYSKFFNNSHFAALKTKDAIADFFTDLKGIRPSVDTRNPDLRINLHISNKKCTISVDTSEPALFKRGYRIQRTEAPINEVLAAGIILLSGIKNKKNIIDPMCGSGTILIEAANILLNIPAGYYRKNFGFQKFSDFNTELWVSVKNNADKLIKKDTGCRIIGHDIDFKAISASRINISRANLSNVIDLQLKNFFRIAKHKEPGIIITNPPYDVRLKEKNIFEFYKNIGNTLKRKFTNWTVYIFSGNIEALTKIGLKPTEKTDLYAGNLKSQYVKYELY